MNEFERASRQLLGEEGGVSEGRMLHNVGLRSVNGKSSASSAAMSSWSSCRRRG